MPQSLFVKGYISIIFCVLTGGDGAFRIEKKAHKALPVSPFFYTAIELQ